MRIRLKKIFKKPLKALGIAGAVALPFLAPKLGLAGGLLGKLGGAFRGVGGLLGGLLGRGGSIADALTGAYYGGMQEETMTQQLPNPYGAEFLRRFDTQYLPMLQQAMSELQPLKNQALMGIQQSLQEYNQTLPQYKDFINQTQQELSSLIPGVDQARQQAQTYLSNALSQLPSLVNEAMNIYDQTVNTAQQVFSTEASKLNTGLALSGLSNTPLFNKTIQEAFSKIALPVLQDKAQARTGLTQTQMKLLTDIAGQQAQIEQWAPAMLSDIMKTKASVGGSLWQNYLSTVSGMPVNIAGAYGKLMEATTEPLTAYARGIQALPNTAFSHGIAQGSRVRFNPIGGLIGGLLGWRAGRRRWL